MIYRCAAIVVMLAGAVSAARGDEPPAAYIGGVWNLSVQPCNGGGGNLMQRHPDEASIRSTQTVELAALGVRIRVPRLPDMQTTAVKIYLGDRGRGVIDHYVLFAPADLAPPEAAIVLTQLPSQFDSGGKVFDAVRVLENALANKAGVTPEYRKIDGPYGEAIEMIVPGRVGTHCFPTSDMQLAAPRAGVRTIGISRFVFTMNKLVEFSLIARVPVDEKAEEADAMARKIMDGYWVGLKPI